MWLKEYFFFAKSNKIIHKFNEKCFYQYRCIIARGIPTAVFPSSSWWFYPHAIQEGVAVWSTLWHPTIRILCCPLLYGGSLYMELSICLVFHCVEGSYMLLPVCVPLYRRGPIMEPPPLYGIQLYVGNPTWSPSPCIVPYFVEGSCTEDPCVVSQCMWRIPVWSPLYVGSTVQRGSLYGTPCMVPTVWRGVTAWSSLYGTLLYWGALYGTPCMVPTVWRGSLCSAPYMVLYCIEEPCMEPPVWYPLYGAPCMVFHCIEEPFM